MRTSCSRRPLRTTSWTSASASGGGVARSSIQRSAPARITNSCCLKNQSAARSSSLRPGRGGEVEPGDADAAALVAPHVEARAVDQELLEARLEREQRARRERREDARQAQRDALLGVEDADVAQLDRRHPAARVRLDRADAHGRPERALARASIGGRHCSMCGRINQWSDSQADEQQAPGRKTSSHEQARARSGASGRSAAPEQRCVGESGGTGRRIRRHEDSVAPAGRASECDRHRSTRRSTCWRGRRRIDVSRAVGSI